VKGQAIKAPASLRAAVSCMLVVAVLATLIGVEHVARRQRVIRLGYQLTDAMAELRQLEEENRQLRLERSVLTNPARIERLALAMGLTSPASGQIRVISNPAEIAIAVPTRKKAQDSPSRPTP